MLLELLEKSSVLMHLDARREDVLVPRILKTNPQLILQLGLNLAVPIRDLDVGDDGVKCTLSFNVDAVLLRAAVLRNFRDRLGRRCAAMVWPEDVPAEVARAAEDEEEARSRSNPAGAEPRVLSPTPNVTALEAPARRKPSARPEPKRAPKASRSPPRRSRRPTTPAAEPGAAKARASAISARHQ